MQYIFQAFWIAFRQRCGRNSVLVILENLWYVFFCNMDPLLFTLPSIMQPAQYFLNPFKLTNHLWFHVSTKKEVSPQCVNWLFCAMGPIFQSYYGGNFEREIKRNWGNKRRANCNQTSHKGPWVKGIYICSNEGMPLSFWR